MNMDNNKIEVGEYVRTKKGIITKTAWIGQSIVYDGNDKTIISKKDIVNHSKNIIDLLTKDDWVNGQHIQSILPKKDYVMVGNGLDGFQIWKEDIKDIVTHEQFNSIKYEIKED